MTAIVLLIAALVGIGIGVFCALWCDPESIRDALDDGGDEGWADLHEEGDRQ